MVSTAFIGRSLSRDTTRRNERLWYAQKQPHKARTLRSPEVVLHRSDSIQNRRGSEQSVGNLILPTHIRREILPVHLLGMHEYCRRLERWCNRCDDSAMHPDCGLVGQDDPRHVYRYESFLGRVCRR